MSRKLIAKTDWLSLFTRTFIDRKGKKRQWDFCSRKENPDEPTVKADAVVVVPFLEDGRMVLIKQFRPAINDYIIENVAGLVDDEEFLEDTAARELKEEVGLEMTAFWGTDKKLYNSVAITDETCSYVFCKVKGKPSTEWNEDSEDIEIVMVNRREAKELIYNRDVKISAKCWLILQAYSSGFDWFK